MSKASRADRRRYWQAVIERQQASQALIPVLAACQQRIRNLEQTTADQQAVIAQQQEAIAHCSRRPCRAGSLVAGSLGGRPPRAPA